MGYGAYSVEASLTRSTTNSYKTKSVREIFTNKIITSKMNPYGVNYRESRDSLDHPNSVPIIIGLDVTGSMGSVPHYLIGEGLTDVMGKIMLAGEKDPQVLFVAVGDHECDKSPLQVAQFESNDELLDKWLKEVYLEGGGGGNNGESYHLAWYFGAKHTTTDSWEKRRKKGLLFTIGDEPVLKTLPSDTIKTLTGNGDVKSYSAEELLDEARKTYNVIHIHCKFTGTGSDINVQNGWKELMGESVLFASNKEEISQLIANSVIKHTKSSVNKTDRIKNDQEIL